LKSEQDLPTEVTDCTEKEGNFCGFDGFAFVAFVLFVVRYPLFWRLISFAVVEIAALRSQ
jgi:hypothetical protein